MTGNARVNTQKIVLRILDKYIDYGYFFIREAEKRETGLKVITEGNPAIIKDFDGTHQSKVSVYFGLKGMEGIVNITLKSYKPDITAQTTVSIDFLETFLDNMIKEGVILYNAKDDTDVKLVLTEPENASRWENDHIMFNLLGDSDLHVIRSTTNNMKITIYG